MHWSLPCKMYSVADQYEISLKINEGIIQQDYVGIIAGIIHIEVLKCS